VPHDPTSLTRMQDAKPDVLLVGDRKPIYEKTLTAHVNLHVLFETRDQNALISELGDKVRGMIVSGHGALRIDAAFMQRFPKLELVSSFGVAYDHIDAEWARMHGVTVTNTPGILDDEVAANEMDKCVVDNVLAWANGGAPLSPCPETPWRPRYDFPIARALLSLYH
jgi:phosphoglycerate dehydrogenase-like enzyme